MSSVRAERWREDNRRYLVSAIERLRAIIETAPEQRVGVAPQATASWEHDEPPAIERLCDAFSLSSFERDILLIAAGVELDAQFAALCASAVAIGARGEVTLGLALSLLDDAHWSALPPSAALRRWRLIRLEDRGTLTGSALRIDERILHFLLGIEHLDADVAAVARMLPRSQQIPPSQRAAAERVMQVWCGQSSLDATPVIRLLATGNLENANAVAAAACAGVALRALGVQASDIPANAAERALLARLFEREAALTSSAIVIDCADTAAGSPEEIVAAQFAAALEARVLMIGGASMEHSGRPRLDVCLPPTTYAERLDAWRTALGPLAARLNGTVERLAGHFALGCGAIETIAAVASPDADAASLAANLWSSARVQGRRGLDKLAERIEPRATWTDLVLPEAQLDLLRQVAVHVRQHWKVFEQWGFEAGSARARGTCALFAGASGTGKTMAAEVLANELSLDLYRVDLARVVSKYVGETEKNLDAIFQAAETAGAILLFDEADALFGKRSEVQNSHDRYANIEVSYLLQRMESYRGGLAILTSNMKEAIDGAFGRRLRFIVDFPFPDVTQRAAIWRAAFPAGAPLDSLDVARLARLNIAGGNIRNIALNAAFRAAGDSGRIGMAQVIWAARTEYAKLGRAPGELAALNNG